MFGMKWGGKGAARKAPDIYGKEVYRQSVNPF